jgi:hypothetical protein
MKGLAVPDGVRFLLGREAKLNGAKATLYSICLDAPTPRNATSAYNPAFRRPSVMCIGARFADMPAQI